jgi:hypothetical protein
VPQQGEDFGLQVEPQVADQLDKDHPLDGLQRQL